MEEMSSELKKFLNMPSKGYCTMLQSCMTKALEGSFAIWISCSWFSYFVLLNIFVCFVFFCFLCVVLSDCIMYLGNGTLGLYHPLILCCTLNDGV